MGDQVLLEAGIQFLYQDPREKAIAKKGVLFISMDFRTSEKSFAFQ